MSILDRYSAIVWFLLRCAAGALAAAATTAILLGGVAPISAVFPAALSLAFLVGLPIFLVLRWRGLRSAAICAIGGFLVGAVPFGILLWPVSLKLRSTVTIGGVVTVQNGWPTFAGWTRYSLILLVLGAVGAVSALAFWAIVQSQLTTKRKSESTATR